MSPRNEFRLDVATGLSLGARERQEDAVLCDVPEGGAAGIVVLSDGLGGHVAGSVASRIAVAAALGEMAGQRTAQGTFDAAIPDLLRAAADAANHAILAHADRHQEAAGLGATLVIAVIQDSALHWLSIGDSPLYLFRDGTLRQINETHSLAPQLDFLAQMGEMDPETAANHPGRSCLTSALGCDPLPQVDCPETSLNLRAGDVIVAASDGILTLPDAVIGEMILGNPKATAGELAARLLDRVDQVGVDGQDNLSVAVLRVQPLPARAANATRPPARNVLVRLGQMVPLEIAGVARRVFQAEFRAGFSARAGRSE